MERRPDDRLLDDIRAALREAPVDEVAITADVADGVVTLTGTAGSHSERLAAVTAARRAAGPVPVVTEVAVVPVTDDFRMTDADIAVEVARAIVQSDVPPGDVWFDVENRVVTLAGTCPDAGTRARVRHLVQQARGVHIVENRIGIAGRDAGGGA
jgi:osmotically-inducible protein OsmY